MIPNICSAIGGHFSVQFVLVSGNGWLVVILRERGFLEHVNVLLFPRNVKHFGPRVWNIFGPRRAFSVVHRSGSLPVCNVHTCVVFCVLRVYSIVVHV